MCFGSFIISEKRNKLLVEIKESLCALNLEGFLARSTFFFFWTLLLAPSFFLILFKEKAKNIRVETPTERNRMTQTGLR